MAEMVWKTSLAIVLAVIVLAGAFDVGLNLTRQETISDWLILYPRWFWIPVALLLSGILVLAIHLYVD